MPPSAAADLDDVLTPLVRDLSRDALALGAVVGLVLLVGVLAARAVLRRGRR